MTAPPTVSPPTSDEELMYRAMELAGLPLAIVAARLEIPIPRSMRHAKGWTGQLVEQYLGASAGSLSEPDFQFIGVELKTIPVGTDGRPRESTYICTVPLEHTAGLDWYSSNVRQKLAKVLWMPFQGDRAIALGERCLGTPLLWQPDVTEDQQLRTDWEDLMTMVATGNVEHITAHHGSHMQIRPKAANSKARRWGVGSSGAPVRTLPLGFYLRARFTEQLMRRHYVMP